MTLIFSNYQQGAEDLQAQHAPSPGKSPPVEDKVSLSGSPDISTPANDRNIGPPGFASESIQPFVHFLLLNVKENYLTLLS